jgi:iron complex transport system substrate-binding protein
VRQLLICWLLILTASFCLADNFPQRIVSGMPSITEMLFALDLGDRVVGVTTNCNYPPEAAKKEKIGGFFLNLEKIAALKPDLVVLLADTQNREVQRLQNFGLPVMTINTQSLEGVVDSLSQLGAVTGKTRRAARLTADLERRISRVRPRTRGIDLVLSRPRVLVIVGYHPLVAVGGGTLIDDLVQKAGLENVAGKSRSPYPQYSFEQLLKDDPEYIIIPSGVVPAAEIQQTSRWQGLAAVKQGKILIIDADVISRPGPRIVDALETIAKFIDEKEIQ